MFDEAGLMTAKRSSILHLCSVDIGGEVGGEHLGVAGLLAHQPLPEGLAHLGRRHPLHRVHPDQPLDHVSALLGDVVVQVLEVALADLLEQLALALCAEWVVALQDHEEEDAEAPQVGVDGHVVPFGDDFWGHVGGRAAEGVDGAGRDGLEAEAEVDELELPVAVEQDVLGLDVAVHDVALVQVPQRLCDGAEELLGLLLLEAVLRAGEQVVVERVGAAVLLDQVDLGTALNDVDELGDDRVAQLRQDVHLTLQVLQLVGLVQPLLLVDLYGHLVVGALADAHLHHAVRPLA